MYYPLEGKNYNFSLYTSEGIIGLLTKKEIKMLKRKKLWPQIQNNHMEKTITEMYPYP